MVVLGNSKSDTSTGTEILNILGVNLSGNTDLHTVVQKECFENGDFASMDGQILRASSG